MQKFISKIFLSIWIGVFIPLSAFAADGTLDDPILFEAGSESIEITTNKPREEKWVRVDFKNIHGATHFTIKTKGKYNTVMFLYKNLLDAQNDVPWKKNGRYKNAKITKPIAYSSPLYLKLKIKGKKTGTFLLESFFKYKKPRGCPKKAQPCSLVAASQNQPDAAHILFTMRSIKKVLLMKTEAGQDVIDLYYAISKDIAPKLIKNSRFRKKFYNLSLKLTPFMEEILRVSLNESTNMAFTASMLSDIKTLKRMLSKRISKKNAKKLNKYYKLLQLKQNVNMSIETILAQSEFMPETRSNLTVGQDYLAGKHQIIIKFAEPVRHARVVSNRLVTGLASVDKLFSSHEVESIQPLFKNIKHKKSSVGLDRIYTIYLHEGTNIGQLIKKLNKLPEIEYAEESKIYHTFSDDVYFPFQYALENTRFPDADIDVKEAWKTETGDPSVLVSVVDTGVDYNRADLAERVQMDSGYDFVNEDNDPMDDNGHGTHVAGIIGASHNNLYNIAGVAPNISIAAFKVLDEYGSGSSDDVASGIIESVDAGAKIINLSLGGSFSNIVEDALQYAYKNSVLSIAAAGNNGSKSISFPASSEYAVSVGATNKRNKKAGFSNFGKELDIMAPGVRIVSLYTNGHTCKLSGTSMAAPHVVGVAALVISNQNTLTIEEIKSRLFEHAFDLGKPGYDKKFGWGLIQAPSF